MRLYGNIEVSQGWNEKEIQGKQGTQILKQFREWMVQLLCKGLERIPGDYKVPNFRLFQTNRESKEKFVQFMFGSVLT